MEGTVQRVRPKLMTVATMLIGLVPLLWADTAGADVMKRIAAPMVGGLVTSAFLTLEIIPTIVTYWRYEQLLWEKLAPHHGERLRGLRIWSGVLAGGAIAVAAALLSRLYVPLPPGLLLLALAAGGAAFAVAAAAYFVRSREARRLMFPTVSVGEPATP
jgi:Cu(I)/Ag(I) efflux system membrane protein CusA/SilA